MAEHGKGPWSHDGGGVYNADGQIVAQLGDPAEWSGDCFHPFDNHEANGRLIAASPTLLEALQNALAAGLPEIVAAEARAAITLATGKDA